MLASLAYEDVVVLITEEVNSGELCCCDRRVAGMKATVNILLESSIASRTIIERSAEV
jgi:hypothetical protein